MLKSFTSVALIALLMSFASCRRDAHSGPVAQYTVERGDTLSVVADKVGVSLGTLIDANYLQSRRLYVGQILNVPGISQPDLEVRLGASKSLGQYEIISRSSWGAPPLKTNYDPMNGIYRITIHHTDEFTAMLNRSDLEVVQVISQAHRNNGWAGIGYHFLIGKDGTVYEGRPLFAQGAHSGGDANKHNIGISLIGDFEKQLPNPMQLGSLESLLDDLRQQYSISRNQLFGHRDFKATECPGEPLYNWLQGYKRAPGT